MEIIIRKAVESDTDQLWILMRDLAIFEKYIDSFAITPAIVKESGFKKNPPDFYCIVAEVNSIIVGMAVYYFLPYTAQNKPALYMKELYTAQNYRGQQIGEKLMLALKEVAKEKNCGQIKWTVAPWNEGGKRFYERLGGVENKEWLNYDWKV
jgi:GNAT superfamily N-acetyltransferase